MKHHNAIPFWKMTGSGNDFVLVDNRDGIVPISERGAFAKAVCRRRVAIGADGVVFIEETVAADQEVAFAWHYINADGSDGAFCGNGAMCGARFAVMNQIAPHCCAFETPAGIVHATVDERTPHVQLRLDPPGYVQPPRQVDIDGETHRLIPIKVGVPHAVLLSKEDTLGADFPALGRAIRHHKAFAPDGANVDLVQVRDRQTLRMRTYERGVEEETLACGSGAIASAIVATAHDLAEPPIAVITSGGPSLHVDFTWNPTTCQVTHLTLTGEARVVTKGEICPEAFSRTSPGDRPTE